MNMSIGVRKELVTVALGEKPADCIIKGGRIINTLTGEIYKADVVIYGDRIAAVPGDAGEYLIAENTKIIDATDKILAPGLMDPHFHIESTSLNVTQLVRLIVPRGVTTVIEDPHEISNVLGKAGIEAMFLEAKNLPINFLLRVPGVVPAIGNIETTGGSLTIEETKTLLDRDDTAALAGDVNPGLILSRDDIHYQKINYAVEKGITIGGQSPQLSGKALDAFVAGGPEDSHVSMDTAEVLDILRHGLYATVTPRPFLFGISDFPILAKYIRDSGIDTRKIVFCTDDRQANLLTKEGHQDYLVRLAIKSGIDKIKAIQMATLNVAENYRLDRNFGSIAAGKFADIIFISDLDNFVVESTMFHGKIVAANQELIIELPEYKYPSWALDTMHLKRFVKSEDFIIHEGNKENVDVRVIIPGGVKTIRVESMPVTNGAVYPDPDRDILYMSMLDRHQASGNIGKCFVGNTGIKNGAIASSVSHDNHNIYTIGTDPNQMAAAVNRLAEMKGGFVVVKDRKIIFEMPLLIAGLMSTESFETVSKQLDELERVLVEELECKLSPLPLYWLALISLPNIPMVGLTDKGLVDSQTMKLISPIVD